MKKILLFAVLALAPISVFAYYDSSSSSGAVTVLGIVSIAAAVLNIILFFKIWGATNDIKAITRKVTKKGTGKGAIIRSLYLQGRDEEAVAMLGEFFVEDIDELYQSLSNYTIQARESVFNDSCSKIYKSYENVYTSLNATMPARFKDLTLEKYRSILNLNQV